MHECCYVNGQCNHEECGAYPYFDLEPGPPEPTEEEYCAGLGHKYYGDDFGKGQCWCGNKEYPIKYKEEG